jgi:hypothetical protein
MNQAATVLQTVISAATARKNYCNLKTAAITLQSVSSHFISYFLFIFIFILFLFLYYIF